MPRAVQDPDNASSCGVGWTSCGGATNKVFMDESEGRGNGFTRLCDKRTELMHGPDVRHRTVSCEAGD
jgi:hypothetical protein